MKILVYLFAVLLNTSLSVANTPPCIPINDDPCINSENPPFDLTSVNSHNGTTCCARGFNDPDNGGDLPNVDCSGETGDDAVWYMYTPTGDEEGFEVLITSESILGDVTVETYWGSVDAGCSGLPFDITAGSACGSLPSSIYIGKCSDPMDVLFIKVATQEIDCGEFTIQVDTTTCGNFANTCDDITDFQIIEPITDPDFSTLNNFCVSSCLDFACPWESPVGDPCTFDEWPTVWFQINVDEEAAQLFTYVETAGSWDAVWSVYQGDDCGTLEQVTTQASPACSNGDETPSLHQTPVNDEYTTYWVAVSVYPSSLPEDGTIDDGSFDICAATTINAIVCIGEIDGTCQDQSLSIEVIEREQEGAALEGPFCLGEEVTVLLSFTYDATQAGVDWLIGIVPKFGPGWDMENFDYDNQAPFGNARLGEWFDENGPCAPILQESLPHMCTYIDDDGNLRLCNALCEACSDCPNGIGMEEGDPLPSGYFWTTNGGNAGCENDCSPGEAWGIGASLVEITWELNLKVKEFTSSENCLENRNLQISFQTFSDGVAGCWEDPVGECLIDRLQIGPKWVIGCDKLVSSQIIGTDQSICSGEMINLEVQTIDSSDYDIVITYVDNPDVEGEGSGSNGLLFEGGNGTINDTLLNLSDIPQEVKYTAKIADQAFCNLMVSEFFVTVYPTSSISDTVTICQGEEYLGFTESGLYTFDNNVNTYGCDSIYQLTLEVQPTENQDVSLSICEGASIEFNEQTYDSIGTYTDSIVSAEGCVTSFFNITITNSVNPNISYVTDDIVCVGSTINLLSDSTEGTWSTFDSNIATIDSDGLVTGVSLGLTQAIFTSSISGCSSDPLTINVLEMDNPLCIVSTSEITRAKILVYPNPTQQELFIESSENIQSVKLLSVNGLQAIHKTELNTRSFILDVSLQTNGMYILEVNSGKGIHYKKVLISK